MIEAELPDGTVLEFPEGTSPDVVQQVVKQRLGVAATPEPSTMQNIGQTLGNIGAGALRGAGSIGATLIRPFETAQENEQRRSAMDAALGNMGAETDSFGYGAGNLGAEIAGTAGAGGALAKGLGATVNAAKYLAPVFNTLAKGAEGIASATQGAKYLAPVTGAMAKGASSVASGVSGGKYAAPLVNALRTGGMSTGEVAAPLFSKAGTAQLATRVAGGAATGGASAALVSGDMEGGATGAMVGGGLPILGKTLSLAGKMISPEKLMQSALKPTLAQQKSGEAKAAIDTLLKYGINATQGGADKLKSMVSGVDDEISNLIAGSGKTVSKDKVLAALDDVQSRFTNQVSPTADIAAIQNVGADFAQHPLVSAGDIPIELAQKLKQGTYKVLEKKYGQIGTAETEAQKGLARGLKEQIAEAIPEVAPLNAKQSELIKALKVTSRRAMMDENRNPVGIAGLSTSAPQLVGMLADRSALLKSLAARGIKAITPEENNALINALRQGVYRGSPVALSGD